MVCPECGVDTFAERRWAAFGLPAWPMLVALTAGSAAWFGLLAFSAWIIRAQAGVDRGEAAAVTLLGVLLALSGLALVATLAALTQRRHLQRAVGEARERLRLLSVAPLVAAGLSWVGVVGVSFWA
ncbi:MAG: hypothetical protein EA378_00570 [Phycisphaerales bacterium]|nr:MAG: hypothetical protein EA378_00570 [Phycisphaerales bacterium]